jgi:hypothetical protein
MYKILLIILIICFICIIYKKDNLQDEEKSLLFNNNSKNRINHNTNEINYGHFSDVHENNILIYPLLKFTTPINITLNAGESLIIPKHWWHWIKSSEITFAINFWSEIDFEIFKLPEKINNTYQNNLLIIDKILSFNKPVKVYSKNSNNHIEFKNTYFSEIDYNLNNYIYTVPYLSDSDSIHINDELHNYISDSINVPDFIKNNDYQFNIWITTGNHDVGLHYDDNDNILSVLKGSKNIILYPPSDSKYLYPYSIIPDWATTKAIKFDYNMYNNLGEIENSYPSSRLLYELINCYNNKKMLKVITNIVKKIGNNKLIYGCKIYNGVFRFEIYIYANANSNLNADISNYQIYKNNKFDNYINQNDNIVIKSFDFYNTKEVYGDSIHFYHNTNLKLEYPFYGYGTTLNNEINIINESLYMVDNVENVKNNINEIINKLNFKNFNINILLKILNLYECKYISIANKYNDHYFIQYFDISCNDFINFIQKYNYPEQFINHVINNKSKYMNIKHEITILFDLNGNPIRTAFYGLL